MPQFAFSVDFLWKFTQSKVIALARLTMVHIGHEQRQPGRTAIVLRDEFAPQALYIHCFNTDLI